MKYRYFWHGPWGAWILVGWIVFVTGFLFIGTFPLSVSVVLMAAGDVMAIVGLVLMKRDER